MGYYGIPCKAAKRVNCLPIKCKITKPMTLTGETRQAHIYVAKRSQARIFLELWGSTEGPII